MRFVFEVEVASIYAGTGSALCALLGALAALWQYRRMILSSFDKENTYTVMFMSINDLRFCLETIVFCMKALLLLSAETALVGGLGDSLACE